MEDLPEQGDPRVLLVMNAVLSAAFAGSLLVVGGFVGLGGFTWTRFVALTLLLMLITHLVTLQ